MALLRKPVRWLIGSVVAVLVLVVGGPFVYIHFIEGKAPAKLSLSNAPAGSANGPLAGDYKVAAGSQAGYRVKEVLFGQNTTAVGRTTAVTGKLTISGSTLTGTSIVVDMTKVTSDKPMRDTQFRGRIMDTAAYPTATFTLAKPVALDPVPTPGAARSYQVQGTLTLRGQTRPVTLTLTARRAGAGIQISGDIPVLFSTWGIANPSFGPVTTQDNGLVEFLLTFTHA